MTNLLAIAIEAAKDNSYSWLIAASLPPLVYMLAKKRKPGWLKRLFIKKVMKRVARKKEKNDWLFILLAILLGIGLVFLAAAWLGWSGLLAVVVVFAIAGSVYRRK